MVRELVWKKYAKSEHICSFCVPAVYFMLLMRYIPFGTMISNRTPLPCIILPELLEGIQPTFRTCPYRFKEIL